ncbi:unnamed protein product [Oikopleura dioica]|uniref:Uncharacterized protein n=2 Tax=Oikopleura dioica TaxID=34765 RepID=E4XKS8_OIKDI|nr:unnamed protein product [Oikopleura dioica]
MFFYGYTCHDIDECHAGTHSCSTAENCFNIITHKDFKGIGYKCLSKGESEKQFSESIATSFEQIGDIQMFEIPEALDFFGMIDVENSAFPKKLCIQYFGGSIEKILSDAEVDSSRWIIRSMIQDINRLVRHICGSKIQNRSLKECIHQKGGGGNIVSAAQFGVLSIEDWTSRMEELISGRVGHCSIIQWQVQWSHRLRRVESNLNKISMEYMKNFEDLS